jgi:hypothetical protein
MKQMISFVPRSAAWMLVLFVSGGLSAQEVERDLQCVPVAQERKGDGAAKRSGGGSMSLPFFDDFASPTFAVENGPEALVRWDDASARRTFTYALNAPTVGQATLDGLRADGFPYAFNPEAMGWADTLTSVPINLMGRTPEDNIHLVFFFQGGGRGNAPDDNDSLVVEFLAPGGLEPEWTQVWSAIGAEMDTFAIAAVHVDQEVHLQDGFRFRYRNHGALGGNVDLWHIDYVLLDDNINPDNLGFFEVAFTEPRYALTEPYSMMPWSHFLSDPAAFMRDSMETQHRNMSGFQADNVTCGLKVRNTTTGAEQNFLNPFSNTFVAPFEEFATPYYVQVGANGVDPSGFAFGDAGNDTAATFEVSLYEDAIGILEQERVGIPDNDSIVFTQVFRNEYAYDDGSAEKAYGLTTGGGKLAMRYDLAVPDTLFGLAIHFTPYYDQQTNYNFLLRAWNDNGGEPGEELGEHYAFHQPAYFTDGADVFAYYQYDDPIPVEGTVYVGVVQESEFSLNMGLDKNTDYNFSRLYYQLGLGAEWTLSTIEGTVMIRPVLQAGVEQVFVTLDDVQVAKGALQIWPNPASGEVFLSVDAGFDPREVQCVDLTGRQISTTIWPQGIDRIRLSVGDLPRGTYLVVVRNGRGDRTVERIILH